VAAAKDLAAMNLPHHVIRDAPGSR
jgi:hypothetical protein